MATAAAASSTATHWRGGGCKTFPPRGQRPRPRGCRRRSRSSPPLAARGRVGAHAGHATPPPVAAAAAPRCTFTAFTEDALSSTPERRRRPRSEPPRVLPVVLVLVGGEGGGLLAGFLPLHPPSPSPLHCVHCHSLGRKCIRKQGKEGECTYAAAAATKLLPTSLPLLPLFLPSLSPFDRAPSVVSVCFAFARSSPSSPLQQLLCYKLLCFPPQPTPAARCCRARDLSKTSPSLSQDLMPSFSLQCMRSCNT